MGYILDDNMDPPKAAEKWLKANPSVLDGWLKGVTTVDGKPGEAGGQEGARPLSQPTVRKPAGGGRRGRPLSMMHRN